MKACCIAIDQVGHGREEPLSVQGLDQPEQRMFSFIENGGVEHLRKESLMMHQVFLKTCDDVAAHHDMDARERFLDQLRKGESSQ